MTASEWGIHKAEMKRLYIEEGKTLKQLMDIMVAKHGFCRTKCQYEQKIKDWGFKKYHVGAKRWACVDYLLEKIEAEKTLSEGKDLSGKRKWENNVYIGGVYYPPKKVKYEIGRKVFRSIIDKVASAPSPSMLEGIIVCPPEAYPSKRPMAQKLPWLSFSQVAELKELQVPPSTLDWSSLAALQPTSFVIQPAKKSLLLLLSSLVSFKTADTLHGILNVSEVADILSVIMPEDYEGQHRFTSEKLLSPATSDTEALPILLYLLSNNMLLGMESEILQPYWRGTAMFQISGLDPLWATQHLLSARGVTAEAISDNLFASAVRSRNLEIITLMLQSGIDPHMILPGKITDSKECGPLTALEFAAYDSDACFSLELAILLMSNNDFNHSSKRASSALKIAVIAGNTEVVELFIDRGAKISSDLVAQSLKHTGISPITLTCLRACEQIDQVFLSPFEGSGRCRTLLGVVAEMKDQHGIGSVVQAILTRGANIEAPQGQNYFELCAKSEDIFASALGLAAASGNVLVMRILLDAGAKVTPTSPNCIPPLLLAIRNRHRIAIEVLINAGASVCQSDQFLANGHVFGLARCDPFFNTTCFGQALNTNALILCQLLLQIRAKASQKEIADYYFSRLTQSVRFNDADTVVWLLGLGARINDILEQVPDSLLGIATEEGNCDIISLLHKAGATAKLRLIKSIGSLQAAKLLHKLGLLSQFLEHSGCLVLSSAIMAKDDDLAGFLLQHSADRSPIPHLDSDLTRGPLLCFHHCPQDHNNANSRLRRRINQPRRLCLSPLEAALCCGNMTLAMTLVARGAPVRESEINACVWNTVRYSSILPAMQFMDILVTLPEQACAPTAFYMACNSSWADGIVTFLLEWRFSAGGRPSSFNSDFIWPRKPQDGAYDWEMAGWWNWVDRSKSRFIHILSEAVKPGKSSSFRDLLQSRVWSAAEMRKALVEALKWNQTHHAQILLEAGADLQDSGLFLTPLDLHISKLKATSFNQLIAAGCNLDYIFGSEESSLQVAVRHKKVDVVKMLLTARVDVNAPAHCYSSRCDRGCARFKTALQLAVETGNMDITELLLISGADVNSPALLEESRTALQIAVQNSDLVMIKRLFDAGANVNGPPAPKHGRTALQIAVEQGDMKLVSLLLERGADVNQEPSDMAGATALQLAASKGYIGIARKLIERGADINAAKSRFYGRTALEGAAEYGRLEILQLFLNEKKEVFLDGDGRKQAIRAIKLAVENQVHAAARFLKSEIVWNDLDLESYTKATFDGEEKEKILLSECVLISSGEEDGD